jgi:pSer/pThr/pTyr-binding forkhead associated (FHA) protein
VYKLVAVEGSVEYPLDQGRLVVGRAHDSDICIPADEVSKRHAAITVDDDSLTIEDLDSTNGTFVNNRRLRARRTLAPGDVVRFESVAFYVASTDTAHTVLAHNLPQSSSSSRSSVSIGVEESAETVFEQEYSLPADWPTAENDSLFTDRVRKYDTDRIQKFVDNHLPDPGDLSAALLVMAGPMEPPLFGLKVSGRSHHWTIGRAAEQSISVRDISVSARHATLIYDRRRWAIRDEQSSNRVKVNGDAHAMSPLVDGDVITLGKVDLVFRLL